MADLIHLVSKDELLTERVARLDEEWPIIVEKINKMLSEKWSASCENAWIWVSDIKPARFLQVDIDAMVKRISEEYTKLGWSVKHALRDGKGFLTFT